MPTPDLTNALHKLAEISAGDGPTVSRIFSWRQILTGLYRQGWDAGYAAAMHDRSTADVIDSLAEHKATAEEVAHGR